MGSEERDPAMRRTLVCCALLALVVGACTGASATYAPYSTPAGQHHAPSYAPAATMAWNPPMGGEYPWPTVPANVEPPVIFPSLGTNPYVDAARDSVSTFGLDVDTASYTVARGYITSGRQPPAASVRPEEWVNYFDQGYAAPETDTFAIHADGGPTPFLSRGEVLLRVGVKARETYGGNRPPAALTFVIDVSGSMANDNRLELVKNTLATLVTQLSASDRLAIVAFTTRARVVLESTSGADRSRILSAISSLHPEDTTNLEEGLRLGYDLERRQAIEGGINRVVLATDGVANVGYTNADVILRGAGATTSSGIQLVAVGVGMGNYNDALLEALADKGEGYYAYVDTPQEARRIFVDDLIQTLHTVALDAKAQIEFNSQLVAGYRLIGYEDRVMPDSSFRNPDAKGGAISAGHQVTALYALVLRQGESVDERLATVSLRWTDPSSRLTKEIVSDVNRGNLAADFRSTDPHFKLATLVAATAEVLRGSPWIPGYRLRDLRGAAGELSGWLPNTTEARDFMSLLDQLARLGY